MGNLLLAAQEIFLTSIIHSETFPMKHFLTSLLLTAALFCTLPNIAQTEYFVSINPGTCIHTRIGSLPGVKMIQTGPGNSAINKSANHYFFVGADAGNITRMYTINTTNGAIVNGPVLGSGSPFANIGGFEFDVPSGQLLGLAWNPSTSTEHFVSVNVVTGAITSINTLPGVQGIGIGQSTYDQAGKRYFFQGSGSSGNSFYIVNANNGNIISSPSTAGVSPFCPRFNNATGKLYALMNIGVPGAGMKVVELDPPPLSNTLVASLASMSGVASMPNYAAIDEMNNRFTFCGISSNVNTLFTVNLATGVVINSPAFPTLPAPQNLIELRYHNGSGNLYGLHWGSAPTPTVITGIQPDAKENVMFSLYPNPFSHSATLHFSKTEEQGLVRIFDAAGKLLREERFYNCASVEIKKENLAAGLYFMTVLTASGTAIRKLLIE